MWKPLSITPGDGRGIQPEDTNRQSLLGTQVRTTGSNVAPFTQTVEEDPGSVPREQRDDLSEIWGEELLSGEFLAEIGPEAFRRPLLTHRNAITTGWKRVGRVSRDNTKAREAILEEDLAKNVSLSLHNSFCMNRESKVKGLPNQAKRLQEQREWIRSYEQLKAWEEIVISSNDEEALLRQITVSNSSGPSTSKPRNTK